MAEHISDFIKGQIIALHNMQLSCRKIASKLKLSKTSVNRIISQYRKYHDIKRKIGSGRPRILKII